MAAPKLDIVVDADVARSSGETQHPISSSCRKALMLMLTHQHSFVACPQVRSEWRKHASGFAKKWLSSMIARKQVVFVAATPDFADALASLDVDDMIKRIVLKDAHLVDAARAKGSFVTSRDDTARASIQTILELKGLCRNIVWINPVTESSTLEDCLTKSKAAAPTLG